MMFGSGKEVKRKLKDSQKEVEKVEWKTKKSGAEARGYFVCGISRKVVFAW